MRFSRCPLPVAHCPTFRMGGRLFTPQDARDQHVRSRRFLEEALAEPHDGPTVVVTHHGPHEKSVAARFRASVLTPAFISDLAPVIEAHQPNLWVHGHTHAPFDYRVGRTRIVCNPLGYHAENPAFDPALVADLRAAQLTHRDKKRAKSPSE